MRQTKLGKNEGTCRRRSLQGVDYMEGTAVADTSCFYFSTSAAGFQEGERCKLTPKISQATGLRELNCECSSRPSSFLAAGCSGNHGRGHLLPLLLPVPCGAMTVIGVSTLP